MGVEEVFKAALCTFLASLCLTAYLTYKLKVQPLKGERLPRKPRPDYLDPAVVRQILACADSSTEVPESCDWLNLVLKWVHAEVLALPRMRGRVEAFFGDIVGNCRRSRTIGGWITGARLLDLQMGSAPVSLQKARVVCTPTEQLPVTVLTFDADYAGGLLGIAKLDILGGWQVHVRCRLCEFSGSVFVMIRDTQLFYGLGKAEELRLRCQIAINGVQFKWLNWLASRWLFPHFLRSKLVLPAMKSKWLASPPTDKTDDLVKIT